MRIIILTLLCLFSVLKASANESIKPYLTSENDSLSIIDGIVDAYNGKVVQKNIDVLIEGSSPLELNRYYDGGHHFSGEVGYGVGLSTPLVLIYFPNLSENNVQLEQRSGFRIPCTIKKMSKKGEKDFYAGKVNSKFFKSGYTNCCEALLNGEPSLLSLSIESDINQFVVILGDGTKRIYRYFRFMNHYTYVYRLIKEELPNGFVRHYTYKNDQQVMLKRIWTTTPDESLTLNWVNFSYGNETTSITTSNGQYVCYHEKLRKGQAENNSTTSGSSVSFAESILVKVSSNYLPECHYDVLTHSHFTKTLFSLKEIKYPDGRSFRVDYNSSERVKRLWKSGLDVPLYQFDYHTFHTDVKDANGVKKRFTYDRRRLNQIIENDRIQHFHWDEKGQLIRQILTDNQGKHVIKRRYHYDKKGNIIDAKVTGFICKKDSKDCYEIKYSYNDRNLLDLEEHPDGKKIQYFYVPNTTLLKSKLTFNQDLIVEREFHRYNTHNMLVETIHDDGFKFADDDLTGVSCRKITQIIRQLDPNQPGLSLPKIVQECCLDLNTHELTLIKKIEKIYDCRDLLIEEKIFDSLNQYCYSLHYEYNGLRLLCSKTDAIGRVTIFHYDSNGNKAYEELIGSGRRLQFVYNRSNQLIHEIEHTDIALVKSYVYDAVGNCIKSIDSFGQETIYKYDALNRKILSQDALGYTIKSNYDVQGHVISETDQEGYTINQTFNIYGKPFEIQYPDGTYKHFVYNIQGYLIQETERDGLRTDYEVDYKGRVLKATSYASDGSFLKSIKKEYKGDNLIAEIDAMGNVTNYSYDFAGRLLSKIQGDQIVTYEYDVLGRVAKIINSESVEVKCYDFLDRVIEERLEDLKGIIYQKTEYSYDIHGNIEIERSYQNQDHYSETKSIYNSRNQIIEKVDALNNKIKFQYHYSGHFEKEMIDSIGRKEIEIFDKLQRVSVIKKMSSKGDLLAESYFSYDGKGNKLIAIHKNILNGLEIGNYEIRTKYNSLNEKISEIEQQEKITSYIYKNSRLDQIIKPDGIILTHEYDDLGRLQKLSSSDGSICYQYAYDLNDNLIYSEDQNSQLTRSYDFLNRLIKEKQASGFEICFNYDKHNRIKEVQFQNDKIIYNYSPIGLISASRYKNDELIYQFSQELDWKGNIIQQNFPNQLRNFYSWDLLDRCSAIESLFFTQSLTYDSVNNLRSTLINDPLGSYESEFSYDELNQLSRESGLFNHDYKFDSLNNRRCVNGDEYDLNHLNQITCDSKDDYKYDKNGNRLSKGDICYGYDALNRLTSVTLNSNTILYKYDSLGRRFERNDGHEIVHYVYQMNTEIGTSIQGNLKELKVIYGEFSPFAIEIENKVFIPTRNHRGDITLLTSLEGVVSSTYRYDAFGKFLHIGEVESPWLLSGQRYDKITNFFQFLHRDYDPSTGRWLTPDPLGFGDGLNLYAYVHNNPLIYVDPYGLWGEDYLERTKEAISNTLSSPRFQGACQMVSGAAEMSAGGAIAAGSYGAAAPIGFAITTHGADHFVAGFKSFVSGKSSDTLTSSALKHVGISQDVANMIDNSISTFGSMKSVALSANKLVLANQKVPNVLSRQVDVSCLQENKDFVFSTARLGSKREPLNYLYKEKRHYPTVINGRVYTGHGLDRMQERGFIPEVVENVIRNGIMIGTNKEKTRYYDKINQINVITCEKGNIISVFYSEEGRVLK